MNNKNFNELCEKVDNELTNFKSEIISTTPQNVYDNFYKIHAVEEFAEFIKVDGKKYSFSGFPKENILEYFYDKFLSSEYNLTNEDLTYFFDYETRIFAKRQKQSEMWKIAKKYKKLRKNAKKPQKTRFFVIFLKRKDKKW